MYGEDSIPLNFKISRKTVPFRSFGLGDIAGDGQAESLSSSQFRLYGLHGLRGLVVGLNLFFKFFSNLAKKITLSSPAGFVFSMVIGFGGKVWNQIFYHVKIGVILNFNRGSARPTHISSFFY